MLFYYLCAAFTFISAAVSFGFSIDAFIKAKSKKGAALTNANYAISRSLSLLLVSIGLFVFPSAPYVVAISAIMIGVQLFDGLIGIKVSRFKTFGPMLTAVSNTAMLVLFLLI